MSYPFTTFPLVNRVGVTNAYAAVDARYGPWNTLNDALTSFNSALRSQGLTVGIYESEKVVEYWYRDGIEDSDLIIKTPDINISGYLPLSGGTIFGNLSVFGGISSQNIITNNLSVSNSFIRPVSNIGGFNFVVSNSGILYDSLEIRRNELLLKSPSQFLQTDLFFDNSLSSSAILKAGTDRFLASIALTSINLNVKSPISVDNSIKVEGIFNSTKNKPTGSLLFRDIFTETVSMELVTHFPNTGSNWIRVFDSSVNARLYVRGGENEIRSQVNASFQGSIYVANMPTQNDYEVKVFCKELSQIHPSNFNVFWLISRYVSNNNFYCLRIGAKNGDIGIYKKINGVFSLLKQINLTLENLFNFYVSLRINGNVISVFIDDIFIDSVQDNDLGLGLPGLAVGNIGVRGNDGVDVRTRLTEFTVTPYNGFEKDSYIDQNRFGVGTKTPNEKLTVSGNISSNNSIYALGGNSQQWNSNFTTVCSLSSQWSQSTNIIPTVTNYLSTNNVVLSSINVNGPILSGGINLDNIFSNTKYYFDNNSTDKTPRYIYYGNGYENLGDLFGFDGSFEADGGKWTRWFVNFGNGPVSGANYDNGFQIYIYPNEVKKIYYNGTSYSVLNEFKISNSEKWDSTYTNVQSNSSKWQSTYSTLSTLSAFWEESTEILPTVTNYLSTNQVQVSSLISKNGVYDAGYFWKQHQAPNNNNWQSITYGNGLFVAIANSNVVTPNRVMTSPDGINWTLRTVPVENNWVSVCYGNGLFVAVANAGDNRRIMTSSDGINWVAINATTAPFESVTYGNGTFVAVVNWPSGVVGPALSIIHSKNGINWFISDLNPRSYKSIAYGNGLFYTITPNSIFKSTDGISFTSAYSLTNQDANDIVYGNGLFAVVANNGSVWVALADSTQSIIQKTSPNSNFTNAKIYYAQGLFFIVSHDTGVWVSQDTLNWHRPISNLTGSSFRDVCYGNGVFVLLANGLADNNNIFTSGNIKNIENNEFNPRYGGFNLYGNLTANNLVIASSGNSNLWTEVYSRVAANSSIWNAAGSPNVNLSSIFATVCSLSTNWNSVYSTTCANSAKWSSIYSYWNPLTANTSSSVSFVNNNSANIALVLSKTTTTSANWDSTYTTLCTLSSKWNLPYDTSLNVNSTNAVENSAIAVKIQSIENSLNILVPAPTYTSPQATLTVFSAPAQTYEVGSSVNQTITLGYTQYNAGSATNFRLDRNNFFIAQQTVPFSYNVNEIVIQGTTTYKNTVTFVDGPIENNILGLPDSRGRILAGTVSLERQYFGRYRQFFGSVSSVPTNLRTLTGNNFDNVNSFTFYAHQVNNVLAIPSSKSLQSAVTQNNETVTGNFALSGVFVNNANGVPVSYKRYVQTTNVPFNVNITFTLSTP